MRKRRRRKENRGFKAYIPTKLKYHGNIIKKLSIMIEWSV